MNNHKIALIFSSLVLASCSSAPKVEVATLQPSQYKSSVEFVDGLKPEGAVYLGYKGTWEAKSFVRKSKIFILGELRTFKDAHKNRVSQLANYCTSVGGTYNKGDLERYFREMHEDKRSFSFLCNLPSSRKFSVDISVSTVSNPKEGGAPYFSESFVTYSAASYDKEAERQREQQMKSSLEHQATEDKRMRKLAQDLRSRQAGIAKDMSSIKVGTKDFCVKHTHSLSNFRGASELGFPYPLVALTCQQIGRIMESELVDYGWTYVSKGLVKKVEVNEWNGMGPYISDEQEVVIQRQRMSSARKYVIKDPK